MLMMKLLFCAAVVLAPARAFVAVPASTKLYSTLTRNSARFAKRQLTPEIEAAVQRKRKKQVTAFLSKEFPTGTPVDVLYDCLAEVVGDDGITKTTIGHAGVTFLDAYKETLGRDFCVTIRDKLFDVDKDFQEELLGAWKIPVLTLYDFLNTRRFWYNAVPFLRVANKVSFFMQGSSRAQFRHEGVSQEPPSQVYLQEDSGSDKVFVIYGASGSGKTADLAGSAYIRGCDLTIFLGDLGGDIVFQESNDDNNNNNNNNEKRKEAAVEMLTACLKEFRKANKAVLKDMASEDLLLPSNKVVVAIDKATHCPLFVRALIADTKVFGKLVIDEFSEMKIETVKFSVGGTGATSVVAGSEEELYELKIPSAAAADGVYSALLGGRQYRHCELSNKQLEQFAPTLHALAKYNARMASIVVRLLGTMLSAVYTGTCGRDGPDVRENESFLVSRAIDWYIKTNDSLKSIKDSSYKSCMLGAQILAVHLFADEFDLVDLPTEENAKEECLAKFEYGIGRKFVEEAWSMDDLISTFGVVVPEPVVRGETPFTVDPAMQLVALHLLGLPPCRNAVQPGLAGFEVTAVQTVRAAIAATTVIKSSVRPPVSRALQLIGFEAGVRVQARSGQELSDAKLFERFKTVCAERHSWRSVNTAMLDDDFIPRHDRPSAMKELASVTHFQRTSLAMASMASKEIPHYGWEPRERKSGG